MKCDILVVEDSPTQMEALRSLLDNGYAITPARSGEEALKLLETAHIDLVLSDIVMPGISGYELCRQIKAHPAWRALPVVLLTSLGDPMDIVRGLEAGADNYITKPYEPEHLIARLEHVLANRKLRRLSRASMGVSVNFLGTELNITSDKEQILDLLLSSIEDIIRTNRALQESRRELAEAHAQLERYARDKAHEAELSAERYHTLVQKAGDAILVLQTDGRIVEANASASDLLGRPTAEIVGQTLDAFVIPEHRDLLEANLETILSGGQISAVERAFQRADGTIVHCEATASLVRLGDEQLVLAIYRDITERKRAEATLRRQELHLREAQEIARLGSWERDVETGWVTFSEQINAIFGFPPEVRGRSFDDIMALVHPDDRPAAIEAGRATTANRTPFEVEYRVVALDGVTRTAFTRGRPEVDAQGAVTRLVGVMQDITEQRALERQLAQAQKMEAVGRLAGGVAHDFNNVLMAIKGSLHFVLEDLPEDHPSRADLQDIGDAANRAAGLTRQLLAFSRQQVLQPQVLALGALVQEHQRLLRRLLPEDIEIRTEIAPDLWTITADPGQMEQVLMNLVVNARDAIQETGSISISLENVVIEADVDDAPPVVPPGSYVRLSVSDSGQGIEDGVLEHIFEPFFTTKPAGMGTGLGLSTVYGIVHQTGGFVKVRSAPGEGATFDIYLPPAEVDASPTEHVPNSPMHENAVGRVLLVEDQPEVRRTLARILRSQGHEVIEANGGPQALELFQETGGAVDLIITDVVMPKMSGVELAERLLKEHPELKFLFMSGYMEDEVGRRGLTRAGVQFLEKPFDQSDLVRKVGAILSEAA
jgi:two-component system cell cycle sensor histidine kinase/response regulator CckA